MSFRATTTALLIQKSSLSHPLLYKKYAIVNKGMAVSSIIELSNRTNKLIMPSDNHDNLADESILGPTITITKEVTLHK